ncbi:STAS domain-containing protein [Streptomyces sp. NRRL S-118]|uniref:STAS domain-containing protein n=1 Tax=Streptomyces sp. NRRL S-118 TaxID=1463881 RepID=UPI0004C539C9|nr:STAS domain-containing protein [Streptomyces sp. NRRL S-118]
MTHIENADRPARLSAGHRMVEGVRVVTLRGEIDHDVKDQLSEALRCEDGAPPRIVADLGGVTFMDSSGINVFVSTHQQVSGAGGWVRIAGAQEAVLRVLQLVGVDAVIPCHPTIEQALTN